MQITHGRRPASLRDELEQEMRDSLDGNFTLPEPESGEPQIVTGTCQACSAPFKAEVPDVGDFTGILLRRARARTLCDPCLEKHTAEREAKYKAEQKARRDAERENDWRKICPELYQGFDPEKLKAKSRDLMAQVLAWVYGERGVLMLGASGAGKSFLAYQLLRRLMLQGVKVRTFDCVSFGHECGRAFYKGYGEEWAEEIAKAPLVYFDDMFKIKLTDRAECELFGVIERRCASKLPILATLNSTGEMLEERLSEDRAKPMIRRLREFNDVITFK